MGVFYMGFDRDDALPGLRAEAAISDADIDRIAVAYGSIYFPQGVEETPANPGDPEADPPVPPTDAVMRPPTGAEVFNAMAVGTLNGILANTIREEKTKAAHDAATGVPDIPVSIKP